MDTTDLREMLKHLSDIRRAEPAEWKTVIRQAMR